MSSPEGLNAKQAENFEQRMEDEYIAPMLIELQKIKSFFPNFDSNSDLKMIFNDIDFELRTMEKFSMDESDLRRNLDTLRTTVENLQKPELDENEKLSIAIEGIKASY